MRPLLCATLLPLATATMLSAQSVTVSTPTGATLFARYATSQQTATLPAGILPVQSIAVASAGLGSSFAVSDVAWTGDAHDYGFDLWLSSQSFIDGAATAQATTGAVDIVFTLSNPTPIYVQFEIERTVYGTSGAAIPIARVDIGDDGQPEMTESMGPPTATAFALVGPTPLVIRCTVGSEVVTEGNASSWLRIVGRSAASVTTRIDNGCSGAIYMVKPRLDGDLDYQISNPFAGSSAAVFGLNNQPLYLGNQLTGGQLLPCLLFPTPDFVVLMTSSSPYRLVVPPAARPITLWSQSVQIGSSLTTSNAFRISLF